MYIYMYKYIYIYYTYYIIYIHIYIYIYILNIYKKEKTKVKTKVNCSTGWFGYATYCTMRHIKGIELMTCWLLISLFIYYLFTIDKS